MRKGQVTIDFLVTLTVVMIFFFSITFPLMQDSLKNAGVMQSRELINADAQKIRIIVNSLVQSGAGAKKVLDLRAPPDCYYYVNETVLEGGYAAWKLEALCPDQGLHEILGYPAYGIKYDCPSCKTITVGGENHKGLKGGEKSGFVIKRIY